MTTLGISSAFDSCPYWKRTGSQLVAIDGCDRLECKWQDGSDFLAGLFVFLDVALLRLASRDRVSFAGCNGIIVGSGLRRLGMRGGEGRSSGGTP